MLYGSTAISAPLMFAPHGPITFIDTHLASLVYGYNDRLVSSVIWASRDRGVQACENMLDTGSTATPAMS